MSSAQQDADSKIIPESGDTSSSPFLELRQLEVTYQRVAVAVQGVSIEVPVGKIVALLGPNGAGKTSILRAVSGFLPSERAEITDGDVLFEGARLNGLAPHRIARAGITLIPEREKVFRTLTVEENLRIIGSPPDRDRSELMEFVHNLFPVLLQRRRERAGYLSGGELQMLAIAQGLLSGPRLLMPDELSLGIAPSMVGRLMDALVRINKEQGVGILMVEQNAGAALAVADYAYIMESGRVVFDGSPERLLDHEDVREFYLGMSGSAGEKSYAEVKQYRRKRRWWG